MIFSAENEFQDLKYEKPSDPWLFKGSDEGQAMTTESTNSMIYHERLGSSTSTIFNREF
jgi:hypothetical protein